MMSSDDVTLTLDELDMLRKLDGHPPIDTVALSREVQPMAIRAVREIKVARELLVRLLALPYAPPIEEEESTFPPGSIPPLDEFGRLRLEVLRLLEGDLRSAELRNSAKASTDGAAARMDEAMQRQGRKLISSDDLTPTVLKAGDLVYRVAEFDPPEKGVPHTWKIESRTVKQASDKQITLKSYFTTHFRIQYSPDAIGRLFFATPALAIEAFAADQRSKIESLDYKRRETERALAWAYGQGAKVPL